MKQMKQILVFLIAILIFNCEAELDYEDLKNESKNEKREKGLIDDCIRPIKTMVINYLNQVGYGFSFEEYFVNDWTGDGILDVIGKTSDSKLIFYKGYNESIGLNVPNTTDDHHGSWNYKLTEGVLVGTGWHNFVEFYPADWSGDGKCDMMALHSDGFMYYYIWNGQEFIFQNTLGHPWGDGKWKTYKKRYIANLDANNFTPDFVEISSNPSFTTFTKVRWNGNAFYSANLTTSTNYKDTDEFYPFDFSHDKVTDFMIRKEDGTLYYMHNSSGHILKQVGTGWQNFQDLYPGYNWSFCIPIASITGRKPNGDFYSYLWNPTNKTFQEGKLVGTNWHFTNIFVGNTLPGLFYRDGFLGINADGKMHAYGTVLDLQ